jgi:hypothetical protein
LLLVIPTVFARLDRLPPIATITVPSDGLHDPLLERPRAPPAERLEARGVEAVTTVVARSVLDVAYETRIGAFQLKDPLGDLEVVPVLRR